MYTIAVTVGKGLLIVLCASYACSVHCVLLNVREGVEGAQAEGPLSIKEVEAGAPPCQGEARRTGAMQKQWPSWTSRCRLRSLVSTKLWVLKTVKKLLGETHKRYI